MPFDGKALVYDAGSDPGKLREWCEREYGSYRAGLLALALAATGLIGFAAVAVVAMYTALT